MNTHTVILDKLRHSVAHPTLRTFLFYAIIALILIKAMGYSGGKGIDILFIALILLLLSIHSLTRYGLIIPFILLCALYAPVGAIYGSPSAVVVSACCNQPDRGKGSFANPPGQLLSVAYRHSGYAGHSRSIYLAIPLSKKTILTALALLTVIIIVRAFSGGVSNLRLSNFFYPLIRLTINTNSRLMN